MEKNVQHTPTPWSLIGASIWTGRDSDPHGHIATVDKCWTEDCRVATAAFIARACNAHDELVAKAGAVARTLEMPTLVRQSTKNENAGFIDWRDWCALKGEVAALRAALAKAGA